MSFSDQYRHHHYFGECTLHSRIEAKIDDTDPSLDPRSFASPGVQRLGPEIFFRLVQATNSALLECVVVFDEVDRRISFWLKDRKRRTDAILCDLAFFFLRNFLVADSSSPNLYNLNVS